MNVIFKSFFLFVLIYFSLILKIYAIESKAESAISLDECFDMAIKNRDLAIADKRFVYNGMINLMK